MLRSSVIRQLRPRTYSTTLCLRMSSSKTEPLALPSVSSSNAIKLDVGSQKPVALDHLGPIVINKDGTLSRITNWDQMTDQEKAGTVKMLAKRNAQRRKDLEEILGKEDL